METQEHKIQTMKMNNRIRGSLLLTFFFLLTTIKVCKGDSYTFTATAPNAVELGQQFSVVFSASGDAKDFRAPSFEGFDVLMGPSKSVSSSTSFINGKVTSEYNVSYTYVLLPQKEGTFTIGSAEAMIKKAKYTTNPLTIKVLKNDATSAQNGSQSASPSSNNGVQVKGNSKDVFVNLSLSKKTLYEQECLLATFKLYTRLEVSGFEKIQFPEFEGFVAQEIELPQEKHYSMESYNGLNYHTVVIKQTLLFPQRTGDLKIPSGHFDAVVRMKTRQTSMSIFDNFFDSYTDVKRTLTTPPLSVKVLPLPQGKPEGYSNGVGDFTISSSISSNNVNANEAITLKLDIKGKGNIKLIKTPEIKFPSDFELYDPKVDVKVTANAGGITGSKSVEYLIVPRFGGDYEIPSTPFAYFDVNTKSYKVLTIPSYKIHVNKGKDEESRGGEGQAIQYTSKENIKHLGKDIRFIKTKEVKLRSKNSFYYASTGHLLCYLLPTLLFIGIMFYYRERIKQNSNIKLMKMRKADKVATKRLKIVKKCLDEHKRDRYYEELSKALWGYLGDKLGIQLAQLTKDNIQEQLFRKHVPEAVVEKIIHILDACEFARYAPDKSSNVMSELYAEASIVIKDIESNIVKK
ncbi:MAG TPA: BatD protein [Porphyromonadaceae bacterium]|nr:BatD protein [Porphyromonadaceae bacterium]